MTRAGEKLYGDWERPLRREGLFSSRRFWRGFGGMMLLLTIASVAIFGFG